MLEAEPSDACRGSLSGHKIRGRRAVSAAGFQGKGLPERNICSQTPVLLSVSLVKLIEVCATSGAFNSSCFKPDLSKRKSVQLMQHGNLRKEPVRFDSLWFRTFLKLIGSVRCGKIVVPVRRGSACVFRTRRGSVRFGSASGSGRFRN